MALEDHGSCEASPNLERLHLWLGRSRFEASSSTLLVKLDSTMSSQKSNVSRRVLQMATQNLMLLSELRRPLAEHRDGVTVSVQVVKFTTHGTQQTVHRETLVKKLRHWTDKNIP
jgi:hypothetical protein